MMSNDGFGKIKQKKVQFSGKPYQRSESKQPPKDDSSFLGRVKGTLKSLLAPSWFVAKSTAPPQTNASSGALLEQLTAPPLNAGEDLRTPSSSKKPEQNDVSGAHGPHRGAPGTPHPYQITTHRFISPEHRPVPQRPAAQVPYLTHLGGQRIGNSPDPFAAPVASRLPDIRVSAPQEPPDPHLGGSVEPPDPRPGFSGEPDRAPLRTPSRTREPEAEGLDDSNISQSSFLRKVDPRHNVSEPLFRSRVSAWDTSDVASSSVAAPSPGPSASKPSFNISLFANSRLVNDQTVSMLGLDPQRSGYYPGKTVFGGASAHRKTRLQPGQPYSRTVGMRKMEAKTSPNNPGGTVTSSTARKILDALDGMSSVLGDAKKVPLNTSSMMDSPMPYTTRGYGRPGSSRRQQSVGTPPLGRLSTPGAARIAANRDQLTLRQTADVSGRSRQMPSTSMPAPVTSTPVLPRSGKIRREKSGLHYKSSRDDDPDYAEPPDLPQPTFHLPVPQNFNLSSFTTPKPASSQSEAGAGSFVQSRLRTAGMGQSSGQSASSFRFATPMMNTPPTEDESVQVPNQNFEFSSPMAVSQATDNGPIPHNDGSGFSSSPFHFDASKARQKPGPTVQPLVAVPGPVFGAQSPVMKSGSVLDALGGGTKSAPVNDVGSLFKPPSVCNSTSLTDNQWSCTKCKNLNSAVKNSCSQCGKSKMDNQAHMKNELGIAEKFKPKTGTWECGTCMVQNKSESETCVCCSAAKPKTNSGTDNMKVIVGNTQQAGKWECPVCMIFNENSKSSCAACQAAKPGKKDMGSSQWECPTCWIQNEESASQCVACSAANPKKSGTSVTSQSLADKFKKPSGSWECDTCMVFNESSAVKCVACETPRPGSTSTSGFSKPTYQFGSAGAGGFKCSTGGAQNGGFTFGGQKLDSAPKVDAPSSGFKFAGGTGTGGFKFGGDTSSKPSVGFSLAKPDDSEQKKPVSSGFTFGGTKDSNSGSGFTFVGDKKESTSVPNSGFSFSTPVVNSSEKTETKPELKTPSFQFGKPASDDSTPKTGLSFSLPKTEDSKKEESKSGFSLKPASSTATDLPSTNSITGLFKFGKMASDTKSESKPPDQKPTFSFGAPASSAPTATVTPTVLGAPADKAPSTLGAPSAFTGFGAPSAAKNELAVVGTKRKTSSEEPAAKKSVGATPFSFSAAPVSTTSATPISAVFGASTSAPSFGAPASKPAFGAPSATPAFGAPSSTPSFGAPSTTTPSFGAPTATPSFGQTAPSAFGTSVFGNSSETPAFGAKPSAAAAPLGGATGSSAGFNFSAAAQPTTGGAFSGGFNFGAAATATPAAGVFQFGAQPQAAPTATPAAPAAFNFTAGATPTFSAGSTPSFTAGPAPTFNAGPAPNTNAGGAFMFSGSQPAAPMAGANPFNAAPASTIAQRKIKKATRRR